MRRRLVQGAIALSFCGAAVLGGELVASAANGSDQESSTTSSLQANTPPPLPDQVQVMGPNGVVAGTVPKSDLVGPPRASTPGGSASAAAMGSASVSLGGNPGYPVTKDGVLVGYWIPPQGFLTIAQARAAGATPATGTAAIGGQ